MVIFEKGDIRLSLITSRLLRVEKGGFTDLKTQTVVCRDFENPESRCTLRPLTNKCKSNVSCAPVSQQIGFYFSAEENPM